MIYDQLSTNNKRCADMFVVDMYKYMYVSSCTGIHLCIFWSIFYDIHIHSCVFICLRILLKGFQETVELSTINVVFDGTKSGDRAVYWQRKISETFVEKGLEYVLIDEKHLVGNLLCVYAKAALVPFIKGIRGAVTPVGNERHVYIHTCIYIYMYICMYIYIYIYVYI
jgi:hypothetical protein